MDHGHRIGDCGVWKRPCVIPHEEGRPRSDAFHPLGMNMVGGGLLFFWEGRGVLDFLIPALSIFSGLISFFLGGGGVPGARIMTAISAVSEYCDITFTGRQ